MSLDGCGRPFVRTILGGKEAIFLMDTGAQLSVTNLNLPLNPDSPICTIVGFSGKGETKATLMPNVVLELPDHFKSEIDIWYCPNSENIIGTDIRMKRGWLIDLVNKTIWKDANGSKPVLNDPCDYSKIGSICLTDIVPTEHLWHDIGDDLELKEIVQQTPSLCAQYRNEV